MILVFPLGKLQVIGKGIDCRGIVLPKQNSMESRNSLGKNETYGGMPVWFLDSMGKGKIRLKQVVTWILIP